MSISRGQPRWPLPFRYRRLDALAPSDTTWALEDLGEFEASYVGQLEALGAEKILADVARIAGGQPACLLCWERPGEPFCHRWVLASFLEEKAGLAIPELEDIAAPRLF